MAYLFVIKLMIETKGDVEKSFDNLPRIRTEFQKDFITPENVYFL